MGGRGEEQHTGDRGAQHGCEVDVALQRAHGGEPWGERHDEQEGEEQLHPRYSNPKFVKQFDEFAVELLVAVFGGLGVTQGVTLGLLCGSPLFRSLPFVLRTTTSTSAGCTSHNGPTLSAVGMMTPAEVWRILRVE
jgi:hypothetical protein